MSRRIKGIPAGRVIIARGLNPGFMIWYKKGVPGERTRCEPKKGLPGIDLQTNERNDSMPAQEIRERNPVDGGQGPSGSRLDFSHQISQYASQDRPRPEFLSDVMKLVLEHSGCDIVEARLHDGADEFRCEAFRQEDGSSAFTIAPWGADVGCSGMGLRKSRFDIEALCAGAQQGYDCGSTFIRTRYGSVWVHDPPRFFPPEMHAVFTVASGADRMDETFRSLALVPLRCGKEQMGFLVFKGRKESSFDPVRLEHFEAIAAKLELALLHQFSQAKLHERVKELTCLYGIAKTASDPGMPFEQKMTNIAALLPPAWQYPPHVCARIVIDGRAYQTPLFAEGVHKQVAAVKVKGRTRGAVEVHYPGQRPFPQGKPFLDEEQSLINNVAGQIARMIEQEEAETVRSELQDQLTRADRLAAIGQLAAGVAHELNEPLNTILGLAQLVQKNENMPRQATRDVERIVEASLHARTIIRELLIFARQAAPSRGRVNLNRIIEDELSLFESLCGKSCVELRRMLAPDLPEITADKSQMLQVISNLMINSLQAMPEGGAITLTTSFSRNEVSLTVEDTGIGMSDEVRDNIFLPFFTTKDVDQGTGLGLAVVHGIVASHSGRIIVESVPGKGARFVLTFPHSMSTGPEED